MENDEATDTCASPYATGTHPVGVADRSKAGNGRVAVGVVVWELVQAARIEVSG